MAALDWYGVVGAASVFLAFYAIRNLRAYIIACAVITAAVAVAAALSRDAPTRIPECLVLVLGVGLCAFGLLFVRVMFIRSVSLNMLRSIQNGTVGAFAEDIGGRLSDMRAFRLIRTTGETSSLTAFGRLIGGLVAFLYALLRIKA